MFRFPEPISCPKPKVIQFTIVEDKDKYIFTFEKAETNTYFAFLLKK